MPLPSPFPRLYPILDAAFESAWPASRAVRALARAGCRLIQLRAKELPARSFHDWAAEAVEAARPLGLAVIVNDRVDVALLTGADGVHLGQEDLSPDAARRILPAGALVGFSTHSVEQARAAEGLPIDYLAIGPIFATQTKRSGDRTLGPEGVAAVRQVVRKPLVAIGGIDRSNGRSVIEAGADSLAVISALLSPGDIEAAARGMKEAWE